VIGLIIFLLLDISGSPGGVPVWRNPIRAPFIRAGIAKSSQRGALVLEKKRSAFYFHRDDGPGETSLARATKNAESVNRTNPISFAGHKATGSADE